MGVVWGVFLGFILGVMWGGCGVTDGALSSSRTGRVQGLTGDGTAVQGDQDTRLRG